MAGGKKVFKMPFQTVLQGVIIVAFYAFGLWRIVATNRGNRVIECGVISLVLVFAEGIAAKSNAPDWVLGSLGVLLLLMCLLTVGLFARECYQGIRRWLRKPS
jgi:hypothetical protein